MISLFGYQFVRKQPVEAEPPSFSPKDFDDGAVVVAAAGAFGTFIDLDGSVRSESELVTRYRSMAEQPEIDAAVEEIVNEMIAAETPVKIITDDIQQSPAVKSAIEATFKEVLELLDFRHHGHDIARRWYIDGRLYFHTVINEQNPRDGIQELRYIDPRKIRKIREVIKRPVKGAQPGSNEAVLTQVKNEYFMYSDKGFNTGYGKGMQTTPNATTGIRIATDAIVHVTSGLTDSIGSMVLSYLHKAIRGLNMLRNIEDAAIIYRLSRASERRVWYIDIGNLPKLKAEQYVKDLMTKHRNKLQYDATTGAISNDRKYQTLLEDYWLPQRDGKGTKVDVLPPGTSFNQIDDILYVQKFLYKSLHVPLERLDPENQFSDGMTAAITKEEIKFGKFIERMRIRFAQLLIKVLEKQMVLKGIVTVEDFQKIAPYLRFTFVNNNIFQELQEQNLWIQRSQVAMGLAPFVGRYISETWMRRNIFKQTDEDIEDEDELIDEEMDDPKYQTPLGGDPNAEGEEDDAENPAVIADQGAIQAPDNLNADKEAKAAQAAKDKKSSGTKKPSKKSGAKSFKSVAHILTKDT